MCSVVGEESGVTGSFHACVPFDKTGSGEIVFFFSFSLPSRDCWTRQFCQHMQPFFCDWFGALACRACSVQQDDLHACICQRKKLPEPLECPRGRGRIIETTRSLWMSLLIISNLAYNFFLLCILNQRINTLGCMRFSILYLYIFLIGYDLYAQI